MRIALINVTAQGDTGAAAVEICRQIMEAGDRPLFCHARGYAPWDIPSWKIGRWFFHPAARAEAPSGESEEKNDPAGKKPYSVGERKHSIASIDNRRRRVSSPIRRLFGIVKKGDRKLKRRVTPRRDTVGSALNSYSHILFSRITDRQGFFSKNATRRLIKQLRRFQPDVVHLFEIHGSYLYLPELFDYLRQEGIPVVWTLNDCWPFTGHCAFYSTAIDAPLTRNQEDMLRQARKELGKRLTYQQLTGEEGCMRWECGCGDCVQKDEYPKSWFRDNSARNWWDKKQLFTTLEYAVLCTPSRWLQQAAERSFLGKYPVHYMPSGIQLNEFYPAAVKHDRNSILRNMGLHEEIKNRFMILSVADYWNSRKGLDDLLALAQKLDDHYRLVIVGLDEGQRAAISDTTVFAMPQVESVRELCVLYTAADLYFSASHAEAMDIRMLQAMACGTQVLCWNLTASPELVAPGTGEVLEPGDMDAAAEAVRRLCKQPYSALDCRRQAEQFDIGLAMHEYVTLYGNMLHFLPGKDA